MNDSNKHGVVIVVVLSFLAALILLAGAIYAILTVNVRNTGFYMTAVNALHDANAGGDYIFSRMHADVDAKTLVLTQTVVQVNYPAPSGFEFDAVTNATAIPGGRRYMFRTTGHERSARAIVEVVVGHYPTYFPGIFGDDDVTFRPNTTIYSYRSSQGTSPTTSTHDARVASNGELTAKATAVDGTIYLGEDELGTPGSYSYEASTTSDIVHMDRIDPDPFGITGGFLADMFTFVAVSNNNASAVGGTISGGQLIIDGNVTLTSGNYYVSEIDLGNNETLTINASAGPVNIYLTGAGNTTVQAAIVTNPPKPDNLRIFSNSTETINFQPKQSFIGFIYAPLATVNIQPNGEYYGAVWGNVANIQPNGYIYIDIDFIESFGTGLMPLRLLSWKQIVD